MSLPTRYGEFAIPIFHETTENEIRTRSINLKSLQYDLIEDNLKKLKTEIKKSLEENEPK